MATSCDSNEKPWDRCLPNPRFALWNKFRGERTPIPVPFLPVVCSLAGSTSALLQRCSTLVRLFFYLHCLQSKKHLYMGLSENSVALHPMVNDHYPYISLLNGYFIGGIPHFQTYPSNPSNTILYKQKPAELQRQTARF